MPSLYRLCSLLQRLSFTLFFYIRLLEFPEGSDHVCHQSFIHLFILWHLFSPCYVQRLCQVLTMVNKSICDHCPPRNSKASCEYRNNHIHRWAVAAPVTVVTNRKYLVQWESTLGVDMGRSGKASASTWSLNCGGLGHSLSGFKPMPSWYLLHRLGPMHARWQKAVRLVMSI